MASAGEGSETSERSRHLRGGFGKATWDGRGLRQGHTHHQLSKKQTLGPYLTPTPLPWLKGENGQLGRLEVGGGMHEGGGSSRQARRLAGGQGSPEVSVSPCARLLTLESLFSGQVPIPPRDSSGSVSTYTVSSPAEHCGKGDRSQRSQPPTQQGLITRWVPENPRNPHGHRAGH